MHVYEIFVGLKVLKNRLIVKNAKKHKKSRLRYYYFYLQMYTKHSLIDSNRLIN